MTEATRSKWAFAKIQIDTMSLPDLETAIAETIAAGEKGYIVTPNAAHVVQVQDDSEFRGAYEHARYVVPDGASLLGAAWLLGGPLKQRITGSDLLSSFVSLAVRKSFSIFLLGAEQAIVERVVARIRNVAPAALIAGYHHGFFNEDSSIIENINAVSPNILFVALGFPDQEKWIARHIDNLHINIAVCVGGVFDVFAGKIKRAPTWVQKIGCEWLWRLLQEPRRLWKRYLISNTIFIFLVIREWWLKITFNDWKRST